MTFEHEQYLSYKIRYSYIIDTNTTKILKISKNSRFRNVQNFLILLPKLKIGLYIRLKGQDEILMKMS